MGLKEGLEFRDWMLRVAPGLLTSQLPAAGSLKGKPWNTNTSWDEHAVISQDLKPSNAVTVKTSVLLLCLPVPTIYAEIFISQLTAQSLRLAAGQ